MEVIEGHLIRPFGEISKALGFSRRGFAAGRAGMVYCDRGGLCTGCALGNHNDPVGRWIRVVTSARAGRGPVIGGARGEKAVAA